MSKNTSTPLWLIGQAAWFVFFSIVMVLCIIFAMIGQWVGLAIDLVRYLFSETKEQTDAVVGETDIRESIS